MPEFKNKEDYEKWKAQRAKESAAPKPVEKPAPAPNPAPKPTEKKCPHCAMMIPTEARVCPHCRKQQPSKTKTYIVLGIIAFIALSTFISFISSKLSDKPVQSVTTTTNVEIKQEDLLPDAQPLKLKYPNWPNKILNNISQKKVLLGMNTDQVIASWGEPQKINETVTRYGKHEQWIYEYQNQYLYFDNGILTSFQNLK